MSPFLSVCFFQDGGWDDWSTGGNDGGLEDLVPLSKEEEKRQREEKREKRKAELAAKREARKAGPLKLGGVKKEF